jgi:hypothetical protein
MSRSDLQIEASRANGGKSRGPITEEGKIASSRNAVKHGMLSECILLPGEGEQFFQDLATELFEEFSPSGPTEVDLVQMMLVSRWRRTRIWFLERQSLANQIADQPERDSHPAHAAVLAFGALANETRSLDLMNRYESRYDRQYFRAHRRLLEIQDRRMRNEPDNTPPPAPGPELVPDAAGDPTAPSTDPSASTNPTAPPTDSSAPTDPTAAPITPTRTSPLGVPARIAGNSSFAKRTQAGVENTGPVNPVAHLPFYLSAILHPAPPENSAVFHAGTAATHP